MKFNGLDISYEKTFFKKKKDHSIIKLLTTRHEVLGSSPVSGKNKNNTMKNELDCFFV